MPSTFFGLSISKSGLYASMAGINTTAHNISNTETEGYCRQVVKQQAGTALRVNSTYGMAGAGSDVTGVVQMREEYYDLKYRTNSMMLGEYSAKEHYMSEIENYFNEIQLEGFTTTFNSFFDSLQELSKKPADLTTRTQVTSFAQSMCEYFNALSDSMKAIQEECNFEIKNQVDHINSLAQQIATMTKQINTLEVNGGVANDLRDARNLLIDELSQVCNVSVTERVVGADVGVTSYVVLIDSQTLVDTFSYNQLVAVPQEHLTNQTDADGLYTIRWSNGHSFDTASSTLGGALAALFAVRDGNNKEAFRGQADTSVGDTTITVSATNVNDLARLNIAPSGVLTVGHREYSYSGFVVKEDGDGGYLYEFELEDGVTVTRNEDSAPVIIGRDVDYKGIPYYMSQMNEFIRTFAREFNAIHTDGEDLNGERGLDFFNGADVVTGKDYIFGRSEEDEADGIVTRSYAGTDENEPNYGSYYFLTAKNFKVTSSVYHDPKKVAAATSILNGVEQAEVAHRLIDLKDNVDMFRQGAPGSFFQTLVSEIGIDSKKAQQFTKNQQNICA
ncbi:MAG: flagellar hook-associated protein FlgK, partial [Lachnospiraceae bacterium]|nr:flagellar hook-associated protein FlgK [Lachnospiraceae bacterium]